MGHITNTHHAGITVQSLEASLAFYRDSLGFEVVFAWNPTEPYIGQLLGYPHVDLHSVILRIPGSDLFLELLEYRAAPKAPIDPANANPGTVHLAFYVDDLDTLYATLKGKGVASLSEPVTPTIGPNKGGKAVYMIDPDGVRVELIQTAARFDDYTPERGG
jgi:lactoylglutathione lyase